MPIWQEGQSEKVKSPSREEEQGRLVTVRRVHLPLNFLEKLLSVELNDMK